MSLTERVPCPFDPVHVIERRRFQAHLIKCKRNLPPNHDFLECPFWHLHYVRRWEFADHLATCEHRLAKEAYKKFWDAEPAKYYEPKLVVDESAALGLDDDSWNDTVGPTFTPEKLISESVYMTVPQGLTKSKRREFKEKERERLRELEDKKKKIDIKQEKIPEEEVLPPPRKPIGRPIDNPVNRKLGRIAAKFPSEKVSEVETNKQTNRPAASTSKFFNNDTGNNNLVGGRGRGTLGWSSVADSERSFHFSPSDFPNL